MLFRLKSLIAVTSLIVVELLFSQNALAGLVIVRASGEITSLSGWRGSDTIGLGDIWTLSYFLPDDAPLNLVELPRFYSAGTVGGYGNQLGWSLTVDGIVFDSAEENVGRASTGVEIYNDILYIRAASGLPTDILFDRYDFRATDVIGQGSFVTIYIDESAPVGGPAPDLFTSSGLVLNGFDLSNASFAIGTEEFGRLEGNISTMEMVTPVPLPAAALLFLSSLFGLGGLRILRK